MKTIDINCDLGEGIGNDELIMPYISSANIACGFHAGDDITMNKTILLAKKFSVSAGAHPEGRRVQGLEVIGLAVGVEAVLPVRSGLADVQLHRLGVG